MMLKLTMKDVLKQKTFAFIAIASGAILGIVYYFLTLSSAVNHNLVSLVVSPEYLAASIGLTFVVAILGGINIALVVYNIKTQRMNLQKGRNVSNIWRCSCCIYARMSQHVQHHLLQF